MNSMDMISSSREINNSFFFKNKKKILTGVIIFAALAAIATGATLMAVGGSHLDPMWKMPWYHMNLTAAFIPLHGNAAALAQIAVGAALTTLGLMSVASILLNQSKQAREFREKLQENKFLQGIKFVAITAAVIGAIVLIVMASKTINGHHKIATNWDFEFPRYPWDPNYVPSTPIAYFDPGVRVAIGQAVAGSVLLSGALFSVAHQLLSKKRKESSEYMKLDENEYHNHLHNKSKNYNLRVDPIHISSVDERQANINTSEILYY